MKMWVYIPISYNLENREGDTFHSFVLIALDTFSVTSQIKCLASSWNCLDLFQKKKSHITVRHLAKFPRTSNPCPISHTDYVASAPAEFLWIYFVSH